MNAPHSFLLLLVLALLLPRAASAQEIFGSHEPVAAGFRGVIYFVPDTIDALPDLSLLTPRDTIHTRRLNIPPRSFEDGFPGITQRIEWFAIEYTATFCVDRGGEYMFELLSDDASRLYIDGELIVSNDGIHGPTAEEHVALLEPGTHTMRVQYMQGPGFEVALVLRWAFEDDEYAVFEPTCGEEGG